MPVMSIPCFQASTCPSRVEKLDKLHYSILTIRAKNIKFFVIKRCCSQTRTFKLSTLVIGERDLDDFNDLNVWCLSDRSYLDYVSRISEAWNLYKKEQIGNDQELAQSERNSHSLIRGVGIN